MKFLGILFKAIFRFFKKNIISVIGMVFLLLFSSTIFTTLNNTVQTLNKSYSKITKEGNLHDFVVNENYRTSSWTAKFKVVDNSNNDIDYTNSVVIDTISEAWIKPDSKSWEDGSKLLLDTYNEWNDNGRKTNDPNYTLFSQNSDLLSGIKLSWSTGTSSSEKVKYIKSRITDFKNRLNSLATNFLTKNFTENIEKLGTIVRQFNSIEITQSKQGKFFKIIEQNYNEVIDKIVIYEGNNFTQDIDNFSGYQNEYVSIVNEFNNYGWNIDKEPTTALPGEALEDTINKYNKYKKTLREYGLHFVKQLSLASWSDSAWNEKYSTFYTYLNDNNFDPFFSKLPKIPGIIQKPNIHQNTQDQFKNIINNNLFYDKEYQLSVNITGTSPITATLTNKRSYEVIVTPEYLKNNNKEPINYNEWQKYIDTPEDEFNRWLSKLPNKNKLFIDNDTYVILGAGMSPDFMYPIVSLSKPLPNINNEVLVYLNNDGFSRIQNTYRGATTENMLYGKFLPFESNKTQIINEINKVSQEYMSWPSNMKSTYMFDDTSNTITPSSQRLVFIPKIVNSVDLISSLLLIFIVICVLIITFILIKRFIDVNKVDLGILLANGYKKWNILFPLTILFLAFILIGNIVGYVLGFSFQNIAMSLFSNFWTIPSYTIGFNWIPFVTFILIGSLLFFGIIWLTSLFILRGDATLLIDNTSANKVNKFSILMKKIFKDKNPLSQLRYSIAFSSIFKLITLTIMGSFITVALTFGFASNNKFNESKEKTFAARQYEYAIDLITPTLQGGQYYAVPYNEIGMSLYGLDGWNDEKNKNYQLGQYVNEVGPYSLNEIKNTTMSSNIYESNNLIDKDQLIYRGYNSSKNPQDFTSLITQHGNFMLPSDKDGLNASGYITTNTDEVNYLQHLIQSKLLINATMGSSITGFSKLWDIAVKLMPSNQKNYCDDANNQILSKLSGDVKNGFEIDNKGYYTFRQYLIPYVLPASEDDYLNNNVDKDIFINQGYGLDTIDCFGVEHSNLNTKYWKINIDRLGGTSSFMRTKLDVEYIMLMLNAFQLPEYASINYLMSYNKIPILEGDKTYSYAMFSINNLDVPLSEQKIVGISNSNKSFLNLVNDKGDDLEEIIINSQIVNNTVPIIINKSFAKRSGLNIGDKINVSINNTVDSYTKGNELFNIWETPIGKRIKYNPELKKLIVDENNQEDSFDYIKDNYDFKVIDILDTYEGNEIYTSQDNVNIITGLKVFDTRNEENKFTGRVIGENGIPFNGIYTNSSNPYQISNSSAFYSLSGLNPGNDQLASGVTSVLSYKKGTNYPNIDKVKSILGYTEEININDIDSFASTLTSIFGQSSYVTITSGATPTNIIEESFNVMNDTLITIQYVLISIILAVSFIIIVLLTFVIVNDALKISSLLKALGLSDIKNVLSLLAIYIPVVVFGILIAIPLAILFCSWYTNFIFNFSGILLNVFVQWWHVMLASMVIVIVFILASLLMLYKLHKKNLANEIK